MNTLIAATIQPVLIAVATVAILELLRLLTPTARWSRRLKHDGDVLAALPDGPERDLWAESVTAQGERLRIYREDVRPRDQVLAWYAFLMLLAFVVILITDAVRGWPVFQAAVMEYGLPGIPLACGLALNLGFALFITVRMIRGDSTALRPGTGGYYPKYDALKQAQRERTRKRAEVERRLNSVEAAEEQARKMAKRAARARR